MGVEVGWKKRFLWDRGVILRSQNVGQIIYMGNEVIKNDNKYNVERKRVRSLVEIRKLINDYVLEIDILQVCFFLGYVLYFCLFLIGI